MAANSRRTAALEGVPGAIFNDVTAELDPYGIDDLDEQIAEGMLSCSLCLSDRLVAAMLDFRQKAVQHGLRSYS
ncbi:hypothetical protein ACX80Z_15435 [Arthrobacter sp. TMT4-20]